MGLTLVEPQLSPAPLPPARFTSYRYWEDFKSDMLRAVRDTVGRVLDDKERQFDLFAAPVEAPAAPAAAAAPGLQLVERPAAEQQTLGAMLSPSQVKTYLDCSARWWFKYGAGLADPASGSLVRGRVVHKLAELYFKARIAGQAVDLDELEAPFELAWEEAAADAAFAADDDIDELKRQAAVLSRKYLDEVAPEIEPRAVELNVTGEIAGVPVRGFVDVIDTAGRIIDLKTASRTPSGVDFGYAFQLATYRQLVPGATGEARIDYAIATKTPKLVTISYTVSIADQLATQHLYPHVREGIREGLYFPNRGSNLCSRRMCNFCDACEREFGGKVE